jgi:GPH family glycoside/pentoside/hexuronide:cation symporter
MPPEYFWTSASLNFLGMVTFGVSITLLFAMFTDCAEYGEWKTGKRTSGLTVSASMFALKFGSALGGALPGFILSGVGFVANEVQTDFALGGIRMMATLVPAGLFVAGGLLLIFYKIDNPLLNKIEKDMLDRRQKLNPV